MTFTHVVCFKWNRELIESDLQRIADALTELRAALPKIREYSFGSDLQMATGRNWDYGIVAQFDSEDDWRLYDTHPVHERVRAEVFRSIIAERAAVQFSA